MRQIGNVVSHPDSPDIAAGFAGVARDILQALDGCNRTFATPGFGRNSRTVFKLFFGKITRCR
jgi:hypothetical protein